MLSFPLRVINQINSSGKWAVALDLRDNSLAGWLIRIYYYDYWGFLPELLSEPSSDDRAASVNPQDVVGLEILSIFRHSLHGALNV